MEVVGQSSGDLNGGEPKDGMTCPPRGDPHGSSGRGWPPGYGGVCPLGCPGYGCTGGHQKPVPQGGQNPAKGGGGHVAGALGVGDPPVHCGPGAWLL
jgi:hypothetical protein